MWLLSFFFDTIRLVLFKAILLSMLLSFVLKPVFSIKSVSAFSTSAVFLLKQNLIIRSVIPDIGFSVSVAAVLQSFFPD